MATTALSATGSATSAAGATTTTQGTLAQNFETFLGLLTTQLKNQSPLDPLDTNQFTQQLVQFASVEQQLKSNDTLTALLTATKASTATGALGFVGARVTASGDTARLSGGKANWNLQLPRSATAAAITITDKTGATVFSETRPLGAGSQSYAWNGRTTSGVIAPDGEYTLTIQARDAAGGTVAVATEIEGTVESVDITGQEPVLTVGSLTIPVSKVKTITR